MANSGFESEGPEALLPQSVTSRLGLWPPPRPARSRHFESPAASFSMVAVPRAIRVALAGHGGPGALCDAVISERETEVVLNDRLVDALRIELVAAGRGLYRIGPRGKLRRSENPERW
ncbi:MAG: hypothetical protein HY744_08680 [Deltaproteobacteria bacterium]|nr:hypothetical protein [Deltaproteobacteria bacterium]